MKKKCPVCNQPAHKEQIEDAKCTFDFHMSKPNSTVEFALKAVQLAFGSAMRTEVEKMNKGQMNQFFT